MAMALAAAGNDDDAVAVDGNLAGGKARRARSSLAQPLSSATVILRCGHYLEDTKLYNDRHNDNGRDLPGNPRRDIDKWKTVAKA
uniref:Uncharacterized protein n=1 Tax=Oryza sativa subsp. japonica TaxID=39947 RepID=Q6Z463_ORYSJ|nr:hypothetical protein [Oryza sativa Japonica Group]